MTHSYRRSILTLLILGSTFACQTKAGDDTCDPMQSRSCPEGFVCDVIYTNETFLTCIPVADGGANANLDSAPTMDAADGGVVNDADTNGVDLGVDVLPPECVTDKDCIGHTGGPVCDDKGSCSKCTLATQCSALSEKKPQCAVKLGECVECLEHSHCGGKAGRPICSTASYECVKCSASADCAAVNARTPICIPSSGECMECGADTDCADPTKPLCNAGVCSACDKAPGKSCDGKPNTPKTCDASTGRCEECVVSSDCANPTTPLCSNKKCVPCKLDSECVTRNGADPGICLASGACATDAEVIYVQGGATCTASRGQGGSRAKPYCTVVEALADATSIRNTILIRGPGIFPDGLSYQGIPSVLNVVGQGQPKIRGASQTAGTLNLRNLTISDVAGPGILVEGDATINLEGVTVQENITGGVVIKPVGQAYPNFDIRNTIIFKNGDGTAVTPGGLSLATTAGRTHRLTHVTIANNSGPGLDCSDDIDMTGLILHNNKFANVSPICGTPVCCSGDPLLTADYHLMSGSPCIDKVPANMSLPRDIDGNARPQGTASDCGADEFVP